ncbi:ExbD/TolR family protein [Rhodohalobacter sp. 614A]|uniref:ExbD/TolR family protein n=1 Tax=Rhodohalobacter sp. 614A TaxID=2908649 RepID=UPI001F1903A5|nr:biopolymer transporter ExbD [Rhodohalobacter sp. 614A]
MLKKKRNREEPEINGSSLADIAFLLLIFFLVVTTIDVDTGIGLILPPMPDENTDPPPVKERNLLNILVNAQGMVLIDEEPASISSVKEKIKTFVNNNGANPDLSESPNDAIVSIKTQRATPYNVYIDMLDEVMGAYAELRHTASMERFGVPYTSLEDQTVEQEEIQELYPKKISIAEPDEG